MREKEQRTEKIALPVPWVIRIIALVSIALVASNRATALDVDGYYKGFFVAYELPGALHRQMGIDETWIGSMSQRLRLESRHRVHDRLSWDVCYSVVGRVQDPVLFNTQPTAGFINAVGYRAVDLEAVLFPGEEGEIRSFAVYQNLDRLSITIASPWFDLCAGRQAIAWGSARTVNPTDVIAPFLYTELDAEDRIGVDALRLRAPLGALGEIDAGYIAGKDIEFSQSAAFLRVKAYAVKTDIAGLLVGFREHVMLGADVQRAVGGAGWWLEGGYVFADALGGGRPGSEDDYLRLSVGMDYSYKSTYGYIEYHFNQPGTSRQSDYPDLARRPAYRDGAVYLLGNHYLAPGVTVQVTPLVTLAGQALVNLTDPSALIAPIVEYNFREDVYLGFGAYVGLGGAPLYLPPTEPWDSRGALEFESEFGAYPDTYYASFRVYF